MATHGRCWPPPAKCVWGMKSIRKIFHILRFYCLIVKWTILIWHLNSVISFLSAETPNPKSEWNLTTETLGFIFLKIKNKQNPLVWDPQESKLCVLGWPLLSWKVVLETRSQNQFDGTWNSIRWISWSAHQTRSGTNENAFLKRQLLRSALRGEFWGPAFLPVWEESAFLHLRFFICTVKAVIFKVLWSPDRHNHFPHPRNKLTLKN